MPIDVPLLGTATERTAEASTSVPFPATVPPGAAAVLMGSVFSITATTNPAGWLQQANFSAGANTVTPGIFATIKRCDGTEGGTSQAVTHGNVVSMWQILVLPGVDPDNLLNVATVTEDGGTGNISTSTLPSMTLTKGGITLVYCAAHSGTAANSTPPTGFTETADRSTGTRDFTVAYRQDVPAGATGTVANLWTTAARTVGVMLAFQPAAQGELLTPVPRYI